MPEVNGKINGSIISSGSLNMKGGISGSISSNNKVGGTISIGSGSFYANYTGDYEVIPDKQDISLDTKNKVLKEDLTVKKVPAFEVSNEFGTTFVIG